MQYQSRIFLTTFCAGICAAGLNEARAQDGAVDTTNYVISDFDSNPTGTPLNGYWFTYTDRNSATAIDTIMGNSKVTSHDSLTGGPLYDSAFDYDVKTFPAGRSGGPGSRSMRFAYELGDRLLSCGATCTYAPYVGFGFAFTTRFDTSGTFQGLDLTGATAISFWAKAEGPDTVVVNVSLAIKDTIQGASDHAMVMKISGPEWKQYSVDLTAATKLVQPSWSPVKPFNLKMATGMGFGISKGDNALHPNNALLIDDVVIENWQYHDPSEVIGIRPVSRASASRGAWRLQVQGSQVRFIRADGDRIVPFNLNGRALPVR